MNKSKKLIGILGAIEGKFANKGAKIGAIEKLRREIFDSLKEAKKYIENHPKIYQDF